MATAWGVPPPSASSGQLSGWCIHSLLVSLRRFIIRKTPTTHLNQAWNLLFTFSFSQKKPGSFWATRWNKIPYTRGDIYSSPIFFISFTLRVCVTKWIKELENRKIATLFAALFYSEHCTSFLILSPTSKHCIIPDFTKLWNKK